MLGIVFDVGANVGSYSKKILELNPQARIFAFEAQPKNYEILQSVSNLQAINLALGNRDGKTILYDYGENDTEHAPLFPKVFGDLYAYHSPLRTFIVDMTTLDDFCSGAKIDNIDFLKIDVEGGEFDVLLGAQEMIAKRSIAVIHFEFNSMNIFTKHFLRDFDALLPGYRLYRVCPTTLLELSGLPVVCQEIFGYQNILAIREDRVPEVTGRLM